MHPAAIFRGGTTTRPGRLGRYLGLGVLRQAEYTACPVFFAIVIITPLVSRWYHAHGCGLVPASGELGFSIAKRLGLLSSIDNWDVGDDQAHR